MSSPIRACALAPSFFTFSLFTLSLVALAACDATSAEVIDASAHDAGVGGDAAGNEDATLVDAGAGEDAATPADASTAPDAGAGDTGCATHVTLTQVQDNVFVGCGGRGPGPMGCHSRSPFQGALDLSPGSSWAELVDHDSMLSTLPRVAPGDLEGSFLWRKLKNELPVDMSQGDPMPKGEAIQWRELPAEQMELVRCWILEGAPND